MDLVINLLLTLIWGPFIYPLESALIVFMLAFVAMGLRDFFQTENAIRRNFPLLGIARPMISRIGPELRQYLFANDKEERPIPRYVRNWIYASAGNEDATVPFGTQLDIEAPGTILMRHSPMPLMDKPKIPRVLVGPDRKQPYETSMFNISAMSFGSLGQNAQTALNKGAAQGGFYHNTGEGGISPYHRNGGDLVWQLGTAKFGARNKDGTFDEGAFAEKSQWPEVKMIEVKLSQGAKPGKGGILPKEKITKEVAGIRGVPMGEDVISPPRHQEWSTPEGMCEFIAKLQETSGKPVGIKFCLGRPEFLDETFRAMAKLGIHCDYIQVDGAEGGTGAAPLAHTNFLGYPMRHALMLTENKLIEYGLRDKIKLAASGKIWTGGDLAIAVACGADWGVSARGFMLSVGCIQALKCNTNHCPAGVATQSRWFQRGLVPHVRAPQVANYQHAVLKEFAMVLASCGYDHPRKLTRDDVMKVVAAFDIRALSELMPYPQQLTGRGGAGAPSAKDAEALIGN